MNSDLIRHSLSAILLMRIQSFHDLTSEWRRDYVFAILLISVGFHTVIEQWFIQKLCVTYFTQMILVCFTIWMVNKAGNICYSIYWFHLGYIWSLCSDLSRHSVLPILLRFMWGFPQLDQWIKQTLFIS